MCGCPEATPRKPTFTEWYSKSESEKTENFRNRAAVARKCRAVRRPDRG